jgi:anaerobic magnesium-protoporphyrin IX monomethyl ester cyclase
MKVKEMSKTIDCLLIGPNDMPFGEYEKTVRQMGTHSGAYRDLNLDFITYNRKPYTALEIINLFCSSDKHLKHSFKPLRMGETFSAAIAYLGTYLNRRGFTFDFINSFQEEKEILSTKLMKENILTIAITTTYYTSAFPILEIMEFIKKYNRTAKIILGGPFISTQVRTQEPLALEYLFKTTIGADIYVCSSQGESTLVNILNALKNNSPLDNINNIYSRAEGDKIAATPVKRENNLLSENMVNWDLFAGSIGTSANIRTSISCPFSCAFCGFPEHAGKFQAADLKAVEVELNGLNKIDTLKSILFIDDTFNVPTRRFKELLKMIIRNHYRFKWICHFRCQFVDREMIELMKESGCIGVFLGIESGNNQILKNMNKAVVVEEYLRGIELLKEYNILTFGSFIVGFPGETPETTQDTVKFINESELDFYRVQLWYCEHITPIWRMRDKYHLHGESFEWNHATMDSKTACDLVDQAILSIRRSIWAPKYNFDLFDICHLLDQGVSDEQCRNLLKAFENGIKEKLKNPSRQEMGFDVIKQFKNCFQPPQDIQQVQDNNINVLDKYNIKFNF